MRDSKASPYNARVETGVPLGEVSKLNGMSSVQCGTGEKHLDKKSPALHEA